MIVLTLLKATLGPILVQMATAKVLKELLLWAGELIVTSTKTPHDNKFFEILKEAADAAEKR